MHQNDKQIITAVAIAIFNQVSHAQAVSTKAEKISRMSTLVEMPIASRSFNLLAMQIRVGFPDLILKSVGDNENLGPSWTPSNPDYIKAYNLLENALFEAEKSNKLVIAIDYSHLPEILSDELTDADINLLEDALKTDLGQARMAQMDALISLGLAPEMQVLKPVSAKQIELTQLIKESATKVLIDQQKNMPLLIKKNPGLSARLNDFSARTNQDLFHRIGQRLMKPFATQLTEIVKPQFSQIGIIVRSYKTNLNNNLSQPVR